MHRCSLLPSTSMALAPAVSVTPGHRVWLSVLTSQECPVFYLLTHTTIKTHTATHLPLVDLAFDALAKVPGGGDISSARGNHDGVRIAVDDLQRRTNAAIRNKQSQSVQGHVFEADN
jgi:hypothetical protein